jgi:hypothetical protein
VRGKERRWERARDRGEGWEGEESANPLVRK